MIQHRWLALLGLFVTTTAGSPFEWVEEATSGLLSSRDDRGPLPEDFNQTVYGNGPQQGLNFGLKTGTRPLAVSASKGSRPSAFDSSLEFYSSTISSTDLQNLLNEVLKNIARNHHRSDTTESYFFNSTQTSWTFVANVKNSTVSYYALWDIAKSLVDRSSQGNSQWTQTWVVTMLENGVPIGDLTMLPSNPIPLSDRVNFNNTIEIAPNGSIVAEIITPTGATDKRETLDNEVWTHFNASLGAIPLKRRGGGGLNNPRQAIHWLDVHGAGAIIGLSAQVMSDIYGRIPMAANKLYASAIRAAMSTLVIYNTNNHADPVTGIVIGTRPANQIASGLVWYGTNQMYTAFSGWTTIRDETATHGMMELSYNDWARIAETVYATLSSFPDDMLLFALEGIIWQQVGKAWKQIGKWKLEASAPAHLPDEL